MWKFFPIAALAFTLGATTANAQNFEQRPIKKGEDLFNEDTWDGRFSVNLRGCDDQGGAIFAYQNHRTERLRVVTIVGSEWMPLIPVGKTNKFAKARIGVGGDQQCNIIVEFYRPPD